jgi:hypothetical protein
MIQADYCGNLALTLTTKIRQVETERLRMKGKRWLRGRDLNPAGPMLPRTINCYVHNKSGFWESAR